MQYQLGCVAKFLGHVVLQALALVRQLCLIFDQSNYTRRVSGTAPSSGISPHVPEGCVDLKNAVIGHAQARPANVTQLFGKMRWPAPTQT
jgi:hypothetical protein